VTHRLVIVRHGNTFEPGETSRRIGARTDVPLVASGRAQAARLAAWFAEQGYRFDRALSSPLGRARETAQTVLAVQPTPLPIERSELLVEIDHGVDEDQPEAAIIARIGSEAIERWDRQSIAPQGWVVDRDRRLSGWAELLVDARPSTTLLVTSNGAARFALLAHPRLASQAAALPSLKLRTAAFGLIDIDADGPSLVAWDQRP
jgi:probable phosphoglycerate mutase